MSSTTSCRPADSRNDFSRWCDLFHTGLSIRVNQVRCSVGIHVVPVRSRYDADMILREDFSVNIQRIKASLTGIAVLALSGCASMSADECMMSDWRAVGYEDGARGYTTAQFGGRRKACAKHGVAADFDAYQEGRQQGLVEYCQPAKGFQVGANGGQYGGVCDAALEGGFVEAYRIGRELFNLRSAVNSAASAVNRREGELAYIDDEIRAAEAALIAKDTLTEDRVLLLAELKDLSERKGTLQSEIETLIADRAAAEVELRNYENTIAEYGY